MELFAKPAYEPCMSLLEIYIPVSRLSVSQGFDNSLGVPQVIPRWIMIFAVSV